MSFTPYYTLVEVPVSCTRKISNELGPGETNRASSRSLFASLKRLKSSKRTSSPSRKSSGSPTFPSFTRFRLWRAVEARSSPSQMSLKKFVTPPSSPPFPPIVAPPPSSSPMALFVSDTHVRSQKSRYTALNKTEECCAPHEISLPLVAKPNGLDRLSCHAGNNVQVGELQRESNGCKIIGQPFQPSSSCSSDERELYYEDMSPLVSLLRKKTLSRARRKISLKLRRFWRIGSGGENQHAPPQKRRLQFHNSRLCKAYAYMPEAVVETDISDAIDLGAWLESLIQDFEENWYDMWRPSLLRFWEGAQFWVVEIGSYILLAPVLIPWEVGAIIGILLNHIWTVGRDISVDKMLFKLRSHMEWIARGEVVGILLGVCMSFTHRRR